MQQSNSLKRIMAIDAVRGLLMVIMAIDHTKGFIDRMHSSEYWSKLFTLYSSAAPFLTRFITHLCAIGFFFLMGASMVFMAQARQEQGRTKKRIIRQFLLRGLLLIFLQLVVENLAWLLGTGSNSGGSGPGSSGMVWLYFGVLYGLGSTMMVGSLLIWLRPWLVALISFGAILATQLLIPAPDQGNTIFHPILLLLLIPSQTGIVDVLYPMIPWLGLMGLGIVFGKALLHNSAKTYRMLPLIALVSLVSFFILRWFQGFGNIRPWMGEGWIGFFNITKYPPSLTFILWNLGINLLLLAFFARWGEKLGIFNRVLRVFGRSALFFYIAHLYVYAFMGLIYREAGSLPIVYLAWFLGLLILYPLCRWYGAFKQRQPITSLWRLF